MRNLASYLRRMMLIGAIMLNGLSVFAQNPFSPYNEIKPKGKIDSVIITYGNAEGTHVYIYNKRRQLIEDIWYRDDIFPGIGRAFDTMKTLFSYGANKHLVSSLRIYKGKKRPASYQYFNMKYGYAIRTKEPGDIDTLVYEMHFNHAGKMIQSGYYAVNNLEYQRPGNVDYKYDKGGNMIERITYTQRTDPNRMFYKYNSNGDEVEIIRGAGQDYSKKTTYKYSHYDKTDNWTQRAVDFVNDYEDDDSIHHQDTITRRISYHK